MKTSLGNVFVGACMLTMIALAYANYIIWRQPIDIRPLDSIKEVSSIKPHEDAIVEVDWSTEFQAGEALDRPLFDPTRREYIAPLANTTEPQAQAETVESPGEPLRPDVRLLGTRSLNGMPAALVEVSGTDPKWIAMGDVFNAWSVTTVTDRKLVLSQGQQLIELDLYHDQ